MKEDAGTDRQVELDFERLALRLGRNHGPALLFDWWYGERLSRDDLRRVISDVWEDAEWPEGRLGTRTWIELFRTVGFISDGPAHRFPTEPLTIYRGTTWGRRRGMAWTGRIEQAEWFAARWAASRTGEGLVFETTVPPDAVLALIGAPGSRDEAEVVVDPALLPSLGRTSVVRCFPTVGR